MLDGFFNGSRWKDNRTDKQKLEQRIKDSVLNLIIDRDQSFLKTARQNNTSIIVNNRDGGIQEFNHDGRTFISFPSGMEKEFSELSEFDAEEKMDSLLKLSTVKDRREFEPEEMNDKLTGKEDNYKDITGEDSGYKNTIDTDGNVINPFEFRASKSKKEDKEDVEEGEDGASGSKSLSSKGMEEVGEHQSTAITTGDRRDREYEFQDTDLDIGGIIPKEVKDNPFWDKDGYESHMTKHREEKLKMLANQIVKSFKGRLSKNKTMIPSKRLDAKALCMENIEKIYVNKHGTNGKHLKINLIIDMSGSMSGRPVENAIEMIYIFNEIAAKGYLTGNVLWSESSSRTKVKFPMPREMVKMMMRTGGGEGLGENLKKYKDMLKEADTNICMTDGQLTNDPILKELYKKEKIEIIGVYVNKNAKDLTEYTGSLDRWFTRSLVRHTTEELCEKLIQFSLRKKK
jgi:hypothetical protein